MSDGAMIALLPVVSEWSKLEYPHLTLVYAGEAQDLGSSALNEMAKDASSLSMLTPKFSLLTTGIAEFGEEEKVDALRLKSNTVLLSMRRFVEKWNASKHPFVPHITIGPPGSLVGMKPTVVAFDRIAAKVGDEEIVFWLKDH